MNRLNTGKWGDTSLPALRKLGAEIASKSSVDLGELTLFEPGPLTPPVIDVGCVGLGNVSVEKRTWRPTLRVGREAFGKAAGGKEALGKGQAMPILAIVLVASRDSQLATTATDLELSRYMLYTLVQVHRLHRRWLIGPRMAQRNHAQFYVLDFGSAAKTTPSVFHKIGQATLEKAMDGLFQQPVRARFVMPWHESDAMDQRALGASSTSPWGEVARSAGEEFVTNFSRFDSMLQKGLPHCCSSHARGLPRTLGRKRSPNPAAIRATAKPSTTAGRAHRSMFPRVTEHALRWTSSDRRRTRKSKAVHCRYCSPLRNIVERRNRRTELSAIARTRCWSSSSMAM